MTEPSCKNRARSLLVMRIWRWGTQQEAPLLSNIHKSNLHQKSLGGYRCFRKSHPIKHPVVAGISERNIQGCPMEVTGFRGRGEYTTGHIQLWLKVGPIASLARFHVVKMKVWYHVLLGRPWLHKHWLVPSTYHQCVKGRLNGRMIHIVANQSPFKQAKAHLMETMFYDQWEPFGDGSVSRPWGTFVPKWEDVWSDPEPDLREVLS